jgi:hypothetical protein
MSLSGFSCRLKIWRWRIEYCLDKAGGKNGCAEMELEGDIWGDFYYRDYHGRPSKSSASVKIIFTDDKDACFNIYGDPWDPDLYIGAIYVTDTRGQRESEEQFSATIEIILPWAAFTNIALMKGEIIILRTAHEVHTDQPTQRPYAYVRSVYFEQ